ncbi:sensor protein lytS [Rudanella paleaurantiibacter]|uniref:Sensor protein lytS n=1 Tax=Rudanella paleaurantiibacter TaxID=2614655 RepID=A0A7J5U4C7_9BACT|nr:sensor histidine kinase [Rudanella paleaurantiibacter]KAB7732581.1 sensor protein lytS [Rudanella paleaurantiibacter]
MPRLLTRLVRLYTQLRQDNLRRYIYLFLLPWFVPIVTYLIFGEVILSGWGAFLSSNALILVLSVMANTADTYLLKRVIRAYPEADQSVQRVVLLTLAFSLINISLAELTLRGLDATRFLAFRYDPETNIWVYSFVFVSSIVASGLIESAYAFMQWQTNQLDRQNLEQEHLKLALSTLKSRINPHFLFNSLNSVSALIADEPQQAEEFVDELSKVYRYMLQANKTPLVAVEAELRFIGSYVQLLHVRYGKALRVDLPTQTGPADAGLPPLTLQLLIDDIIQHNTLMASRPLQIHIEFADTDRLCIRHNCQPRTVRVDTQLPGFADVLKQYESVGGAVPQREVDPAECRIYLPLLPISTGFYPNPVTKTSS